MKLKTKIEALAIKIHREYLSNKLDNNLKTMSQVMYFRIRYEKTLFRTDRISRYIS